MSFLPYAPQRSTTWAAAIGGSTAIHGAVVLGLLTSSVALLPEPTSPAVREPEYEITLEIIDADIIDLDDTPDIPEDAVAIEPEDATADLLEEDSAALTPDDDSALLTPEEDTIAPEEEALPPAEEVVEPEPEPLVEEELALLEPEPEVIAPEPEVIEPEVIDEPIAAAEPDAPAPEIDPDDLSIDDLSLVDDDVFNPLAEAVAPAADAPLAPDVVVPDVVEPEAIIEEDIAAVVLPAPTVIEPEPEVIAPEPEAEPETPVALPEPVEEPAVPEVVAEPEVVEDAPAEPATGTASAAAIPNPSPAALQIGALLQRIRSTPAPQCTLVLPRRAGDDGVGLSFIGAEPDALDTLAARIVDGLDIEPPQTREILDARQCAALDAIRLSAAYPASRIGLALEDTTLSSGEALQARVLGAGGLFLTLILVDDNGVVQDLARFTTLDGNDPVIDAPVARSGPSRDTRQMLIVLGSPDEPIDLSQGIGQLAQDAFAALPREALETALFGAATFDVR